MYKKIFYCIIFIGFGIEEMGETNYIIRGGIYGCKTHYRGSQ